MNLRGTILSLMVMLMLCGWVSPAAAQWGVFQQEEEEPEPPQDLPPLPEGAQDPGEIEDETDNNDNNQFMQQQMGIVNAYQQQRDRFPPLPPARPCVANDILGIWRLAHVYEEPGSQEVLAFRSNRFQYLMFKKDSIYGKYSSATVSLPAPMVPAEVDKQQGLHQYVMSDSGIIYFYTEGVAVDSQACFIVANERGPYLVGQMILMPPKGQRQGRLAKVYMRYDSKKIKRSRRGRRR